MSLTDPGRHAFKGPKETPETPERPPVLGGFGERAAMRIESIAETAYERLKAAEEAARRGLEESRKRVSDGVEHVVTATWLESFADAVEDAYLPSQQRTAVLSTLKKLQASLPGAVDDDPGLKASLPSSLRRKADAEPPTRFEHTQHMMAGLVALRRQLRNTPLSTHAQLALLQRVEDAIKDVLKQDGPAAAAGSGGENRFLDSLNIFHDGHPRNPVHVKGKHAIRMMGVLVAVGFGSLSAIMDIKNKSLSAPTALWFGLAAAGAGMLKGQSARQALQLRSRVISEPYVHLSEQFFRKASTEWADAIREFRTTTTRQKAGAYVQAKKPYWKQKGVFLPWGGTPDKEKVPTREDLADLLADKKSPVHAAIKEGMTEEELTNFLSMFGSVTDNDLRESMAQMIEERVDPLAYAALFKKSTVTPPSS